MKRILFILLLMPVVVMSQTSGFSFASNAEYGLQMINSGHALITSGNTGLTGNGGAGTSGVPLFISVPGVTFVYSNSTLHGSSFVSSTGDAYWTGNNTCGEGGVGSLTSEGSLVKIALDSRGLTFNNIKFTQGSYIQIGADDVSGQFWVKSGNSGAADTIFFSGWEKYGNSGRGFTGSDTVYSPTIVYTLPSGLHVLQMWGGVSVGFLRSDGTVWDWGAAGTVSYLGRTVTGSNYASPQQVIYPAGGVTQVAGGAAPGVIALHTNGKLYGFSNYSWYMGNKSNPAYNSPTDLTDSISSYILNGTTRTSFVMIASNSTCFHYIMNDGSLWGNGDGATGDIGDGSQANLLSPGGTSGPGFIDPSAIMVYAITHPVRVTNRTDYVFIATGVNFAFVTIAITADGHIHLCGRGKGGILPNGIIECFSDGGDIGSFYPDFCDVADLTPMNPTGITTPFPQTWLGCFLGSSTANCHSCGPTSGLTAFAGFSQSLSVLTATLNGTGSASIGGTVTFYRWSYISGPTVPVINQQASPTPILTGLANGTYVIGLKVKDNGFDSATSTVTLIVNTGCNCIIQNKNIVYEKPPYFRIILLLLLFCKEPDELQG